MHLYGGMMELADMLRLDRSALQRAGASPATPTIWDHRLEVRTEASQASNDGALPSGPATLWGHRIEVSSPLFQSGEVGALPTGPTIYARVTEYET